MQTKKVLTAKKLLPCLIVNEGGINSYVIKKSDGTFVMHDHTNYIDVAGGNDFDESEFIDAYYKLKEEIIKKRVERAEEERQRKIAEKKKEEERIEELMKRIKICESPLELADEFGFDLVETAGHWSDLYEGRSGYAVLISSQEKDEIFQLAIDFHNFNGDFGEATNRSGEHHYTFYDFSEVRNLSDYQKLLNRRFVNDNKLFYCSKETEAEVYTEKISQLIEDGNLDPEELIAEIEKILKKYNDIEPGYYDCNGGLMMSDEDLNDPELSGYSEDVYRRHFAFQFEDKHSFYPETEDEEE